ncbi:MAG: hypothetical protein Q8N51_00975 [Gammaproteobacteria bacterium]|nr:hypothetical protein [Gammaproteobacteria bacterium]
MNININVSEAKSGAIVRLLQQLIQKVNIMSAELDRLTSEVAENGAVIQSAITLLNGLAQQIRDNANDPAALTALADELDANEQALAAAVAANTPSA